MVPKPQHSDSVIRKDVRSPLISNLTEPITMPATIKFDCELGRRAIEIEYVAIYWVLTAKLVSRKISVSKMSPERALSVGCFLSQNASAIHGTPL
jgi:hypothetical protein